MPQLPPLVQLLAPGGLEITWANRPAMGKYVPPAAPLAIRKNSIFCASAAPACSQKTRPLMNAAATTRQPVTRRCFAFPVLMYFLPPPW